MAEAGLIDAIERRFAEAASVVREFVIVEAASCADALLAERQHARVRIGKTRHKPIGESIIRDRLEDGGHDPKRAESVDRVCTTFDPDRQRQFMLCENAWAIIIEAEVR